MDLGVGNLPSRARVFTKFKKNPGAVRTSGFAFAGLLLAKGVI
jgi:hypothetical protein